MTGKILILGASSFVGRHLMDRLGSEQAIGTYNNASFKGGVRFDSTTMSVADVLPDTESLRHAVILMGDTQPDSCVADPMRSQLVNIDSIKKVIDQLLEAGIKIVFTSSEFVFSGELGNYVEKDRAEPIMLYGQQKLAVENYLREVSPQSAILRLAKVFGMSPGDGTMFVGMLGTLLSQARIRIASDQRFSPVYVGDVCNAILASINQLLSGIYHVAGPQGASRIELLRLMMAEVAKYRPVSVQIEECSIHDFDLPEPRPLDVSMRPDKLLSETGLTLLSAQDACRAICENAFK